MIWALLARAGVRAPLRVLDAGCGTGRNLLEFGVLGSIQGAEISSDAIEFCAARGIHDVTQAPIERMPFEDGSFDLILATDVIEHLADDRVALTELHRVAAPGARLLVTVPAYRWLWGPHDEIYHHQRRYTLSRLRTALVASGWTPVLDRFRAGRASRRHRLAHRRHSERRKIRWCRRSSGRLGSNTGVAAKRISSQALD